MAAPVLTRRRWEPGVLGGAGQIEPPARPPSPDARRLPHLLHSGDSAFREIRALGNLDLVITCLFAFCFIFSLTKYGHFLPSAGMERNEEQI